MELEDAKWKISAEILLKENKIMKRESHASYKSGKKKKLRRRIEKIKNK